ncbi:hypothetical protein DLH72_04490 [Candidatus Gracilibacteria bacterium]|nr:MAG: hypothetical protein DLH72_04490 [Candidatus Gracilibacteria bacterium]
MIFELILVIIGFILAFIGVITGFILIAYILLYLFDDIDGDDFKKYFIRYVTVLAISIIGVALIEWVI